MCFFLCHTYAGFFAVCPTESTRRRF
nr:unnamed protein product [Digitaria exilis]